MIKYIGSKRALLPWIVEIIEKISKLKKANRVVDLFSGSSRVGHALKAKGFDVVANDINAYAFVLAQTLVEADAREYTRDRVEKILAELMRVAPVEGWFTKANCIDARYFQPKNGAKIEAIRELIESVYSSDPLLKAILLTSLILAADKVDSTTGIQMAYLKDWAPRAYNDLRLEYPPLLPGTGKAFQGDALDMAGQLEADIFYLDPPYNQHSYLGNYHVWETLVRWDNPQTYGVAQKRVDVQERKSPFNSKREAKEAMRTVLSRINANHVVVSFSNEGFFAAEEIEAMLKDWGYVVRLTRPHQRYVGARIGIYNPKGEKVGQISHTENREFLFVATHSQKVCRAFQELSGPPEVYQSALL
ncbi:DNA adenine methylase [Meiothermus sp.]|uniref:DNA adenine methylase n=1 Tax=Meiothermus sp. TaxID=1955249 RepID=UPI0021DD0868|nr:DNA adenine methylase [Meiothermus sp.]GIW25215.1 MAG: restriction endonuclease subunit M [Meiothermus sp.]